MRVFAVCLAIVAAAIVSAALAARPVSGGSAEQVVLGSKTYDHGVPVTWHWLGWGTARPPVVSNGGDPGGVVFNIHWHKWGQPIATAYARTSIYLAKRGWYWGVWIEVRAVLIGKCPNADARAYLHLQVRERKRLNGPLGPWIEWGGGPPRSHGMGTACGVGRHS